MVKFISYDGAYPVLCFGTLVVEIDGKRVSFGHTKKTAFWDGEVADYPSFWHTGGGRGFSADRSESYAVKDDWKMLDDIDDKDYPEDVRKLLPEILKVMNENTNHGCCGGCL